MAKPQRAHEVESGPGGVTGPPMEQGLVRKVASFPGLPAVARMQLAKAAGFDTIRITAIWEPGQSAVPAGQLAALQAIAAAGDFLSIRVITTVMNFGSRTTPLTAASRTQFARFAADLVKKVPSLREYIV